MTPNRHHRPGRRLLAVVTTAAAALVLAAPAATAVEPPAASSAVRFVHLSPDLADVDVTLTPFSSSEGLRFDELGYGEVSDYRAVAPGFYNAEIAPGDQPDAAALLTASVEVAPGAAATVAVTGAGGSRATTVLTDDLTPPPPGQARVRLLQGASAAESVDVSAVDGPVIAEDVAFGAATGYANVPAGTWTLEITPSGGASQPSTTEVTLRAGSVQTLLLLDEAGGVGAQPVPDEAPSAAPAPADGAGTGLVARVVADGQGMPQMPTGAVQAGWGPGVAGSGPGPVAVLAIAVLVGAIVTARLLHRPTAGTRTAAGRRSGL